MRLNVCISRLCNSLDRKVYRELLVACPVGRVGIVCRLQDEVEPKRIRGSSDTSNWVFGSETTCTWFKT